MIETKFSVGEKIIESLSEIAPSVRNFIIEFAFGEIYSRDDLNLEERKIITFASLLTAGGCENKLKVHINGALNVGISP